MMTTLAWLFAVACTTSLLDNAECFHCFTCNNITHDEDCRNVTQCAVNERCYVERNGHGNTTRFSMGCINSERCQSHRQFTIVGRATNDKCLECCAFDGCNKELCEIQNIPAVKTPGICEDVPFTNCSEMSHLANICSDIQQAKQFCRKFCGLCDLVDGGYSAWSSWTSCSLTCGIGSKTRRRTCTNPAPQHGGDNCTGANTQVHSCFVRDCPVHGEWNPWGGWEGCSVSCGTGVNKRHRTCTNPAPSLYGHYCIGDAVDYDICSGNECRNSTSTETSTPTPKPKCHDVLIDCKVLNQTTGVCSSQQYARQVCPEFCGLCSLVDGRWAGWSSWGSCSTTCGSGTWLRSRTCTNPAPVMGGKPCAGNSTKTGLCMLRPCPVHGNWSPWAKWASCSSSCGQGLTHRRRTCTNPRPSFNGNYCFGDPTEYAMCLVRQCSVNKIPAVVFNVHGVTTTAPNTGETMVFSTVSSNIGSAYNQTTGIFTAPFNGTYSFTLQLCINRGKTGRFSIVLDGNIILPFDDSSPYMYGSTIRSSGTVPQYLSQGQKVWVRSEGGCSNCLYQNAYCWDQFSGSLVHN